MAERKTKAKGKQRATNPRTAPGAGAAGSTPDEAAEAAVEDIAHAWPGEDRPAGRYVIRELFD